MRNRVITLCFFFTICLFFSSCTFFQKIGIGDNNNNRPPNEPNADTRYVGVESVFDVQFVQDGSEVPVEEGIVRLSKNPFSIFVNMREVDGVYLNATTYYSQKYEDDNTFDDLNNIYPKIMAEPAFNQGKELFLSEDNYCYWFYDENLDWHRLSDVQVVGDEISGEKIVQNFFYPDQTRKIPVNAINEDVYLFFFALEDKLEDGFQLRQRQYIKLEWE
ncbi:MAG: hypothetical protein AAFO94_17855 [Bacteroidota bacterium]